MPIYNIDGEVLTPIRKVKFQSERELQNLTEKNLEELFGLKFIASEFQVDNLRIDTLAFNEQTNSFVIIEYKNVKSYSVVDQGYSYLALLLNNKAEFVLKYNLVCGTTMSKDDFDFSQTCVMFISPSYTTYQLRSVEFSDIAFELWKVVKYSNGTVLFDKVNNTDTQASIKQVTKGNTQRDKVNREIKKYTEEDTLMNRSDDLKALYESLKESVLSEYDDVEIAHTKDYFNFKVGNKFIFSAKITSKNIRAWGNIKEADVTELNNNIKGISNVSHNDSGHYDVTIDSEDDLHYFNLIFKESYDEKT